VIFGKENRFLWLGKINSALLFSEECLEWLEGSVPELQLELNLHRGKSRKW
jgi:hypothetical protein